MSLIGSDKMADGISRFDDLSVASGRGEGHTTPFVHAVDSPDSRFRRPNFNVVDIQTHRTGGKDAPKGRMIRFPAVQ